MRSLDFARFETLHGEPPVLLLDRHPDGRHVAMQADIWGAGHDWVGVWDAETGQIAWAPEGGRALAWFHGGEQAALIYSTYTRAHDHPAWADGPLQSEFKHTLCLVTWPERQITASCALTFPTGVPGDLVVSPREDLAVVQWFDQEETGLEFITFSADGPSQVHHTGLPEIERVLSGYPEVGGVAMNTVYTTRPVFSPDGRYIVLAWQSGSIWWSSDRYYFDEHGILVAPPSPGGEYTIGTISILDWDERTHHAIPVVERVSPGWRPAPEKPAREGAIDDQPVFTDNEHFTLALPTGTARTFSVRP